MTTIQDLENRITGVEAAVITAIADLNGRVTVTPGIAAATAPPVRPKPVPGQLIPTGQTGDLLMVVTAGRLYALTREQ